jgi:hypothetical protein
MRHVQFSVAMSRFVRIAHCACIRDVSERVGTFVTERSGVRRTADS